jgi:hypothetical protein
MLETSSISCMQHYLLLLSPMPIDLFLYGSLAVRDLSNLIKPEDMVTTEHLVTLLSIVPKYSQKDWLASYESLDTFVVS